MTSTKQLRTATDASGETFRLCTGCYFVFPLTQEFFYRSPNPGKECRGFEYACRSCRRQSLKTTWKQSTRAKRYGLSNDGYTALLAAQDGRCAICRQLQILCVDHDHQTGLVRGLLCHRCNRILGHFHDSPELFRAAADYLEAHNEVMIPSSNGGNAPGSASLTRLRREA